MGLASEIPQLPLRRRRSIKATSGAEAALKLAVTDSDAATWVIHPHAGGQRTLTEEAERRFDLTDTDAKLMSSN